MLAEYADILYPLHDGLSFMCLAKKLPITVVTTLVHQLTEHLAHVTNMAGDLLPVKHREVLRNACNTMHAKILQCTTMLWHNQAFNSALLFDPFSKVNYGRPLVQPCCAIIHQPSLGIDAAYRHMLQ